MARKKAEVADGAPTVAESLLNAARELFTKNGYEGTSVAQITQRAGLSVGTLYYHFGGKAEIFTALHEGYFQRQDARVREAITIVKRAGITDRHQLFLAGTRAYLSGVWTDRDVSRVIANSQAPAGFEDTWRSSSEAWTTRNTVLLAEGESDLTLKAIVSAVTGSVGAWARDIVEFEDEDTADAYIEKAVTIVSRALNVTP